MLPPLSLMAAGLMSTPTTVPCLPASMAAQAAMKPHPQPTSSTLAAAAMQQRCHEVVVLVAGSRCDEDARCTRLKAHNPLHCLVLAAWCSPVTRLDVQGLQHLRVPVTTSAANSNSTRASAAVHMCIAHRCPRRNSGQACHTHKTITASRCRQCSHAHVWGGDVEVVFLHLRRTCGRPMCEI